MAGCGSRKRSFLDYHPALAWPDRYSAWNRRETVFLFVQIVAHDVAFGTKRTCRFALQMPAFDP